MNDETEKPKSENANKQMNNAQLSKAMREQHEENAAIRGELNTMAEAVQDLGDQTAKSFDLILKRLDEKKGYSEPAEMKAGGDGDVREFASNQGDGLHGDIEAIDLVTQRAVPLDVDSPEFKAKAEMEEFLSQPVRILIHAGDNPKADSNFAVMVNGKPFVFFREKEYNVPRFIVEALARAKPATYNNIEYVDEQGITKVRWPKSSSLRYPFAVIQDPAGAMGARWLSSVMAQS